MIELKNESKNRKFRPADNRDESFEELVDLNLWYKHEIPKAGYTYEDALGVFVNRLYNYDTSGNKDDGKKRIVWRKELEDAVESGSQSELEKSELYSKAKTTLDELLDNPDVGELIPKKYWDKFSNFYGINPDVLHHSHLYIAFENELKEMEKLQRADVLLVCHCSAIKPYSKNKNYERFINASRETRLFDVCVMSLCPTMLYPYDASNKYPYICYDWPHVESPGLVYHYTTCLLRLMVNLIRRLNYKKVVFLQFGHMKHLNILKDHYGINYIDIAEQPLYAGYHNFLFSNKELNENFKVYKGINRQRILMGSRATALFMKDLFGSRVAPWFEDSWGSIPKEVLDFVGYPNGKLDPIAKQPEIECW